MAVGAQLDQWNRPKAADGLPMPAWRAQFGFDPGGPAR